MGTGYADYVNASNDYIEFTVNNVPAAANYDLTFRYAVPNAGRELKLTVNNVVKISLLDFPGTGDFNTWGTLKTTQALVAGTNKIRLTATGASGPNIDQLVVTNSTAANAPQIATSIETHQSVAAKSASVYPNPFKNGVLRIDLAGFATSEKVSVRIANLTGQLVHSEQLVSNMGVELHLSNKLTESVYLVVIESGETKIIKKLVVK